ncbi:Uncharacterised protein [Mycobacteroides abscessus subsp. massiliense]|nr:Uncharacterised protein [Mycobacteroides abscessus subsp. massiliense]
MKPQSVLNKLVSPTNCSCRSGRAMNPICVGIAFAIPYVIIDIARPNRANTHSEAARPR